MTSAARDLLLSLGESVAEMRSSPSAAVWKERGQKILDALAALRAEPDRTRDISVEEQLEWARNNIERMNAYLDKIDRAADVEALVVEMARYANIPLPPENAQRFYAALDRLTQKKGPPATTDLMRSLTGEPTPPGEEVSAYMREAPPPRAGAGAQSPTEPNKPSIDSLVTIDQITRIANAVYTALAANGDACNCGNGRIPVTAYRTAVDAFAQKVVEWLCSPLRPTSTSPAEPDEATLRKLAACWCSGYHSSDVEAELELLAKTGPKTWELSALRDGALAAWRFCAARMRAPDGEATEARPAPVVPAESPDAR
jgi:hypothetical protein